MISSWAGGPRCSPAAAAARPSSDRGRSALSECGLGHGGYVEEGSIDLAHGIIGYGFNFRPADQVGPCVVPDLNLIDLSVVFSGLNVLHLTVVKDDVSLRLQRPPSLL